MYTLTTWIKQISDIIWTIIRISEQAISQMQLSPLHSLSLIRGNLELKIPIPWTLRITFLWVIGLVTFYRAGGRVKLDDWWSWILGCMIQCGTYLSISCSNSSDHSPFYQEKMALFTPWKCELKKFGDPRHVENGRPEIDCLLHMYGQ